MGRLQLTALLFLGLLTPAGARGQARADAAAEPVVIAVLAADSAALAGPLRDGLIMGSEEAATTARLLRRSVALHTILASDVPDLRAALRESGAAAVLSLLPAPLTDSLASELAPLLTISLVSPPDSLPRSRALPNVLHVLASDSARRAALARAGGGERVVSWTASLERFGAAQLNARYVARFHEPMTEAAWLGWFAVKAVSETALRAAGGKGDASLAAALRSGRAVFDGHKGAALRFDPGTGELQAPLYVLDATGKLIDEAGR